MIRRSLLLTACLASTLHAEDKKPLAPILQGFVDHKLVAGVVALVADKDKVLDLESAGFSSWKNKTPMQDNSLFWIASMTKSVTGALFMMLVDEGKVKIDDPVEKYLPEFKGQMVLDPKDKDHPHPPAHPITLKEVLSHTSGMVSAGDKVLKQTQVLKDNVSQYAKIPLHNEPGTKFEYNNAGINTAARVIEVVSGQSYYDFLQQRLLTPLGMKETSFWPGVELAHRLAHSARRTEDKKSLEEIEFDKNVTPAVIAKLSEGATVPHEMLADFGIGKLLDYARHYGEPAGGLMSTATDMGLFCQMLLNGGTFHGKRYLSEAAVKEMGSVQTGNVPVNPQEGYGLGWFVKIKNDEGPSVGSFGHRGARRTVMWVDPTNELVMILMVERFDMTGDEQKEVYGSFMKAAVERWGKKG